MEYKKFNIEINKILKLSGEFAFLWFCSNYFYNLGLSSTSVSSSTVLCSTSSIFVYIISLFLLKDVYFHPIKALMVLLSFSGILIVNLVDQNISEQQDTLKGNIFSLLSAIFYGIYAVILKKRVPDEKETEFKFSYFLGFVGLFNFICLIPLIFLLNFSRIEIFEWPNTSALKELILNAVLGTVIADYCWAKSVVLLGPLLTTLGIALTIPISMIIDSFISKR